MKTVSDIGERELINLAKQIYQEHDESIDLSDDCATIPINDEYVLASTDMISVKTHIPKGMSSWQIGWFITAINLSDIAAKGGHPIGILLSLGLPKTFPKSSFLNLIKGASSCAIHFNTSIIGGDTKENDQLVLSGTALGKIKKEYFLSRKGAVPGDIIAVTGRVGKAAAGLYELQNNIKHGAINELCEPIPRVNEGIFFAETKKVHCCMDLSDGISASLYQLADLNNVGFQIEEDQLPVSNRLIELARTDTSLDVTHLSLHFGGDYELLITTSEENFQYLKEEIKKYDVELTKVGSVIEEKKIYIQTAKNTRLILPNLGYEHLKN